MLKRNKWPFVVVTVSVQTTVHLLFSEEFLNRIPLAFTLLSLRVRLLDFAPAKCEVSIAAMSADDSLRFPAVGVSLRPENLSLRGR